jgi:hypothetical protein
LVKQLSRWGFFPIISEMDDQILKRVLFEYIKDRQKEQTYCQKLPSQAITGRLAKQLILLQKLLFFLYEPLYTSSHGLKYDYPLSGLMPKTPRPIS